MLLAGQAEYNRHMDPSNTLRSLKKQEIEELKELGNLCPDWSFIRITGEFDPSFIRNCRIEAPLELIHTRYEKRGFQGRTFYSGLESSTLGACRIEGNAAVIRADYLSGYHLYEGVLISSVKEMIHHPPSTFGQGYMDSQDSPVHALEAGNELGSRWILPQENMLPPDIRLWAGLRGNKEVMKAFQGWSSREARKACEIELAPIAPGSVIKNSTTIRNIQITGKALVSGALRLEEITICGSKESPVLIEEGSDLRYGILKEGCRVSHSIAGHFYLGAHSNLTKGARFFHSVLSENSTISCCEVISAFTGAFHEQHHNNSFLIASMVEGQSNVAAGATIGSNHNSRSADGEIRAGRGFWPALSISLKHNSRFASYTLITRGQYPCELNIRLPFSLVSQSESELHVMPAYWQQYNLYGLMRNSWKFRHRDKRKEVHYLIESHWLAPDTLTEIQEGLNFLENLPGASHDEILLESHSMENSRRPVRILKAEKAKRIYRHLVDYNLVLSLLNYLDHREINDADINLGFWMSQCSDKAEPWINLAGTPISAREMERWQEGIVKGELQSWEDLHRLYLDWMDRYPEERFKHALSTIYQRDGKILLPELLNSALEWEEFQWQGVQESRSKDRNHPFRHITFDSPEEQEALQISLDKDPFLLEYQADMKKRVARIRSFLKQVKTS